jgi:hypothetical protein
MSPSTLAEDSPIWPLFQTVLGVSPPSIIVHIYRPHRFHSFSPSYKSHLSASPATSSLGEVSLIGQRRRSYLVSHLILLTCLSCSQKLNSINVNFFTPCLLFSKVAFFLSPGSQPFPCIRPIAHALSREIERTMDRPHLLLTRHWHFIGSSLAPR